MVKKEHRNYLMTLLVLVIAQLPDFMTIPATPFWYLYSFNAFIDLSAFTAVLCLESLVRIPILCLLGISIAAHFMGITSELLYAAIGYESMAILNDYYKPLLIAILISKILVMAGGYGMGRRKRTGSAGGIDHAGYAVLDHYDNNIINQRAN